MDIVLQKNYNDLQQLHDILSSLNYQSRLYPVSSDSPVPLLVTALKPNTVNDSFYAVNIAFSPFDEKILEHTRLLQLSIDTGIDITTVDAKGVAILADLANTLLPIGHFTAIENSLCYRFAYAVAEEESLGGNSFLEAFALYGLLFFQYSDLFQGILSGEYTWQEAYESIF